MNALEMDDWRRSIGVSRTQRVKNVEMREGMRVVVI